MGQQTDQVWLDARRDEALLRLGQAESPADRGALLREALRLAGGQLALAEQDYDLESIPAERFGLRIARQNGAWLAEALAGLPPGLPPELDEQFRAAWPVDPRLRRHDDPATADGLLLRLTQFSSYRNPTQKAAVRTQISMPPGAGLLVSMSTGSGKSLLFQLASLWWRERDPLAVRSVCVVLAPTVALALDHELSMRSMPGLDKARAMVGGMNHSQRDDIARDFRQGLIPVLILSPEMALGYMQETLCQTALPLEHPQRPLAARGLLRGLFVDEAHIVATWGRSFRPDLQRIPGLVSLLRSHNPALMVTLLSATVDDETLQLLRQQYQSGDACWRELIEGLPRREFDIIEHFFRDQAQRDRAVLAMADILPRPAIVYATRAEDAKRLYEQLRHERGYRRLGLFTGQTPGQERRRIIESWRTGGLDLVVGTSAFGMGVDKADVRAVIHACLPENASRHYQEIGRAGRDGRQAMALLLACQQDKQLARELALGSTMKAETAKYRWDALLQGATLLAEAEGIAYLLPLDAKGEHLDNFHTGSLNIRWNKSLLVQLQRFAALEVLDSPEAGEAWKVAAAPGSQDLWDRSSAPQALERILAHRENEEASALNSLKEFMDIWQSRQRCRLESIFAQVESGRPQIAECGRCLPCRADGLPPATTSIHRGGKVLWPPHRQDWPACRMGIVESLGSLSCCRAWVRHLAEQEAVIQFVVPVSLALQVATALAEMQGRPGWVLTWDQVGAGEAAFLPLAVSTALVAPMGNAHELDRAWRWSKNWSDRCCIQWWVALPGALVEGRYLDEVASIRASVSLPEGDKA